MALTTCPACHAEVFDLPDHEISGRCRARRFGRDRNQAHAEALLTAANVARLKGEHDTANTLLTWAKQAGEA